MIIITETQNPGIQVIHRPKKLASVSGHHGLNQNWCYNIVGGHFKTNALTLKRTFCNLHDELKLERFTGMLVNFAVWYSCKAVNYLQTDKMTEARLRSFDKI